MTTGVHGLRDKPYKEAVRLQSRPMIKLGDGCNLTVRSSITYNGYAEQMMRISRTGQEL